jgi:mRNA interferase HigB
VNVIAPRTIRDFIEQHPESETALREWYNALRRNDHPHFASLRQAFVVDVARNDQGDPVHIFLAPHQHLTGLGRFDIAGNHYRVICFVNYENQTAYIKYVFTHREYERWNQGGRPA